MEEKIEKLLYSRSDKARAKRLILLELISKFIRPVDERNKEHRLRLELELEMGMGF
ncbi:MAG: hypothetical protein HEQ25_02780 [Dolichospermum sp. DET73]|nr:hypothetical protein [Dolichospermum sp. DET73]